MEVKIDKPKEFQDLQRRLQRARKSLRDKPMQRVLEQIARMARGLMAAGIESGRPEWPPLAEFTKQQKGHGRRLVDTGEMLSDIAAWREGDSWYAGIPATAPSADRAAVQENGAHVPVTDKMRAFFRAQGAPLRADTRFIRIPPRPWLAPAEREVEAFLADNLEDLMEPVVEEILGG